MEKLTKEQIESELKSLKNWNYHDNSIKKTFKTKNFNETLALVVAIGGFCQQHDHHPDYLLMKYSQIEVSFSTHSHGGVTIKDINIAKDIDTLNF